MSGAAHEPDPRVERLVEQARYWQGMHTIDIPTDELRGLLLSAYAAGEAAAAATGCACVGCGLDPDLDDDRHPAPAIAATTRPRPRSIGAMALPVRGEIA